MPRSLREANGVTPGHTLPLLTTRRGLSARRQAAAAERATRSRVRLAAVFCGRIAVRPAVLAGAERACAGDADGRRVLRLARLAGGACAAGRGRGDRDARAGAAFGARTTRRLGARRERLGCARVLEVCAGERVGGRCEEGARDERGGECERGKGPRRSARRPARAAPPLSLRLARRLGSPDHGLWSSPRRACGEARTRISLGAAALGAGGTARVARVGRMEPRPEPHRAAPIVAEPSRHERCTCQGGAGACQPAARRGGVG